MDKKEIIQYLANVVSISRVDGKLSSREEEAIECVRQEVKATKTDLNKAIKSVEQGDHVITPVGRLAEKIRNLEDMIFISISDGELAQAEKAEILSFAKSIKVTQEQITEIMSEAKLRIKFQSATIKCDSCNKEASSEAKFCPHCGSNIHPTQVVTEKKLDFEIPDSGISIEFADSTSASFDTALDVAKSAPTYQECKRSNKKWYCATWPTDQMLEIVKLADQLMGLRNRKVYFDGKELPWGDVFGFVYCMKDRQQAYRPTDYCFGLDEKQLNIWGCRQADMDWSDWSDWFSYGSFENESDFIFDKQRIRHELGKNLNYSRFCPFFRPKFVEAVFNLLPDKVKVTEDGPWKYKQSYHDTPGSRKIIVKEEYDGFSSAREMFVDGVCPRGFGEAKKILQTAASKFGITQLNLKSLV
jgi:Zn finger protein HypA/HybF involved in hydrogenase expression